MSISSKTELGALLAEAAEGCVKPLESSTGLPPPVYSDPAWFAREQADVFGRGWVAAARVEHLREPGSYRSTNVGGEPIVVVRDRDGDFGAFSNVCRHRGTIMVEGSGVARSLQCPHHGWTYRLNGQLASAPHMADQFSPSEVCLPRFAVAVWGGWVLVNLSGDAPDPSSGLDSLDEVLADEQLTDLVSVGALDYPSPWNWKISVENFVESYHHQWVHPDSLQVGYPGGRSFARHGADQPWSAVDHVSVIEGSTPFLAAVVYPNLLFAVERGVGLIWFELTPIDQDSSHLRIEGPSARIRRDGAGDDGVPVGDQRRRRRGQPSHRQRSGFAARDRRPRQPPGRSLLALSPLAGPDAPKLTRQRAHVCRGQRGARRRRPAPPENSGCPMSAVSRCGRRRRTSTTSGGPKTR